MISWEDGAASVERDDFPMAIFMFRVVLRDAGNYIMDLLKRDVYKRQILHFDSNNFVKIQLK